MKLDKRRRGEPEGDHSSAIEQFEPEAEPLENDFEYYYRSASGVSNGDVDHSDSGAEECCYSGAVTCKDANNCESVSSCSLSGTSETEKCKPDVAEQEETTLHGITVHRLRQELNVDILDLCGNALLQHSMSDEMTVQEVKTLIMARIKDYSGDLMVLGNDDILRNGNTLLWELVADRGIWETLQPDFCLQLMWMPFVAKRMHYPIWMREIAQAAATNNVHKVQDLIHVGSKQTWFDAQGEIGLRFAIDAIDSCANSKHRRLSLNGRQELELALHDFFGAPPDGEVHGTVRCSGVATTDMVRYSIMDESNS